MMPTSVARGALHIEEVVKIYDPHGARIPAVDRCSFNVAAGEICMIVGPSGCGKTTLLNAIAGFLPIDGGTIRLDGEILCGAGRPQAKGPEQALDTARRMMAEAGLGGLEHLYPGETSSGVRRRVEIVRALINDPTVLLLDEPYRALDALTKSVMHEALLEMYYRKKTTIFFITHDLEEAIFLGHRVIVMTSRPCRPKLILDVDIPYPRDYGVLTSPRFRELMGAAAAAVQEEAAKAFELGEKEGVAA
jgi:NitT/TauT family transport system ATP-binding protein